MIHRLAFAAAALLAAAPLYAVTYTFEPQHTQGVIRWNHLGFANPTAQFNNVEGTLEFDAADPLHSSVVVTIPLTSMSRPRHGKRGLSSIVIAGTRNPFGVTRTSCRNVCSPCNTPSGLAAFN